MGWQRGQQRPNSVGETAAELIGRISVQQIQVPAF